MASILKEGSASASESRQKGREERKSTWCGSVMLNSNRYVYAACTLRVVEFSWTAHVPHLEKLYLELMYLSKELSEFGKNDFLMKVKCNVIQGI